MTKQTHSSRGSGSDPGFQRQTRQRAIIKTHIDASENFRTASQIHHELRDNGQTIGLSTIYRFLQALADQGDLDVVRLADGEAAYRRCSMGHHHHLVCRSCGHTVEVAGPAVERWATQVAEANGYRDVQHDLEIFGLCDACAAR